MTAEPQCNSAGQMEGAPLIQPSSTDHPLYEQIVEACRSVYDPEIPVNIYDLGLVYTIDIDAENARQLGYTINGGGGVLVVLSDRVNLDVGATLGYRKLGNVRFMGVPVDMGSGVNGIARVGLAIGLGG